MRGIVNYLGTSRIGLMFGKISGEDNNDYYFDNRSLIEEQISDYQINDVVNFNPKVNTYTKNASEVKKIIIAKPTNILFDKKSQHEFFNRIANWSIEASTDNDLYYCDTDEIENIKSGNICCVIGRKGTGKSALVKKLALSEKNEHSAVLSFKNFPLNILYECANSDYPQPNQFISIWQLIIYQNIGRMMLSSKSISKETATKLRACLDIKDTKVKKIIEKLSEFNFGINVLSSGFNVGVSIKHEKISWIDQLSLLQEIIKKECLSEKYFLLFDELDEDYKKFVDEKEKQLYISMLTSLIKAVQYVRRTISNNQKSIWPIVFLRTDIYAQLTDADKNKWRETILELEWDLNKIKKVLAYRIFKTYNSEEKSENMFNYDLQSRKVFESNVISMGNCQSKQISIFSYITRSTQWRPRDYIQYIKTCVNLSLKMKNEFVTPQQVKSADDAFSEYLKQETVDEIFPVIPNILEILAIFSSIRKQTFNPSLFINEYNIEVNKGNIQDMGAENVLNFLFNYSIIGNQPSMKGQSVFKYAYKDAKFNFKENIIIHRGLFKTLQIF